MMWLVVVRAVGCASDDCFAGDSFISVASQNHCETVLGRCYGHTRPTKVKASFDSELKTEVVILDTLPSVNPRDHTN